MLVKLLNNKKNSFIAKLEAQKSVKVVELSGNFNICLDPKVGMPFSGYGLVVAKQVFTLTFPSEIYFYDNH